MISASVYRTASGETGWGTLISFKFGARTNINFEISFDNVLANNSNGDIIQIEPQNMAIITSVNGGSVPINFELSQNYPNPFNPSTTIEYSLPKSGNVHIAIFDLLGKKVRTLISGKQQAGRYSVLWDATNDEGMTVLDGLIPGAKKSTM